MIHDLVAVFASGDSRQPRRRRSNQKRRADHEGEDYGGSPSLGNRVTRSCKGLVDASLRGTAIDTRPHLDQLNEIGSIFRSDAVVPQSGRDDTGGSGAEFLVFIAIDRIAVRSKQLVELKSEQWLSGGGGWRRQFQAGSPRYRNREKSAYEHSEAPDRDAVNSVPKFHLMG